MLLRPSPAWTNVCFSCCFSVNFVLCLSDVAFRSECSFCCIYEVVCRVLEGLTGCPLVAATIPGLDKRVFFSCCFGVYFVLCLFGVVFRGWGCSFCCLYEVVCRVLEGLTGCPVVVASIQGLDKRVFFLFFRGVLCSVLCLFDVAFRSECSFCCLHEVVCRVVEGLTGCPAAVASIPGLDKRVLFLLFRGVLCFALIWCCFQERVFLLLPLRGGLQTPWGADRLSCCCGVHPRLAWTNVCFSCCFWVYFVLCLFDVAFRRECSFCCLYEAVCRVVERLTGCPLVAASIPGLDKRVLFLLFQGVLCSMLCLSNVAFRGWGGGGGVLLLPSRGGLQSP